VWIAAAKRQLKAQSFNINADKKARGKSGFKRKIRDIPDFPKEGILFRDITTLLKDRESFSFVVEELFNRYHDKDIDVIAGIESRG